MMRAKMTVESVQLFKGMERLTFRAVCSKGFGPNGESEDNTYAKFTPSGTASLDVTNLDLHGKIRPGQSFYIDFTLTE